MAKKKLKVFLAGAGAIALIALVGIGVGRTESEHRPEASAEQQNVEGNAVTVSASQAKMLKVETVALGNFVDERETAGYIDFNQDRTVPVFSPWPGRITQVLVKAGDDVRKGETLFTIDSPDLVQAESTLISTAGILDLATKSLDRARKLADIQGNTQKDLEQAIADQQTAEGNYKAARNAVRIFGKSEADLDRIVASRKTDGQLAIVSPLTGRVTARNAAPGLLAQPGTAPAPVTVADISSKWMVASVPEYLLPRLHLGAKVDVSVSAYPGRRFESRITNLGAAVDPNTHTLAVRTEIADPRHELLPQMLATFVVRTGEPMRSPALPQSGVVREGDGTMTVFVTQDGLRFERRAVKTGVAQNGMQQILEGVSPGEKVATDGALFLSNALALSVR